MKIIFFLFYFVNCTKIINNGNLPSCRNCVYYTFSHFKRRLTCV